MPRQRRIIQPIDQTFEEAIDIIAQLEVDTEKEELYEIVKQKLEEKAQEKENEA